MQPPSGHFFDKMGTNLICFFVVVFSILYRGDRGKLTPFMPLYISWHRFLFYESLMNMEILPYVTTFPCDN